MTDASLARSQLPRATAARIIGLLAFIAVGAVVGSLSYGPTLLLVLWGFVFASCGLFLLSLRLGKLTRDWFFILGVLQAVIYLHLAPTLAFSSMGGAQAPENQRSILLQGSALLLFEFPLLLIYLGDRRRTRRVEPMRGVQPELAASRYVAFVLFCIVCALAYLAVILKNGLIFRRVGHALLAQRMAQMPTIDFAIYRSFGEAGLLLVSVLIIASTLTRTLRQKCVVVGALLLVSSVYLTVELVNSRYNFIVAVGFVVGIIFLWKRPRLPRVGLVLGFMVVLAVYSLFVAANFRSAASSGGDLFALSNFNPFGGQGAADAVEALSRRLNGVDLMAKITPSAMEQGFAWGKAWRVPFIVTFGQFINRQAVAEYKLGLFTTAKSYLLSRYTTLPSADYYSCMLTDAYGNFFMLGFPLAAVVWAIMLSRGTRMIQYPQSRLCLVVGLMIILLALRFEKEFVNLLTGWVRMLPVAVPMVALCPLKWVKQRSVASCSVSVSSLAVQGR